ncbi:MAG: purine-binding chemotaxis protein CheW [Betaproteobacteria bacterium]|nr:purine-binding chemotaxis protein CheW [Betaproteobacteria bacterium]
MTAPAAQTGAAEYLTFSLVGEEYAIDILRVREIREFDGATRVAGAAARVVGVMNLRGAIVPIMDLRVLIGLPSSSTEGKVVIIVALAEAIVGMLVDQVNDVIGFPANAVHPVPPTLAVDARHMRAIGIVEGRMILLLDALSLLGEHTLPLTEAV